MVEGKEVSKIKTFHYYQYSALEEIKKRCNVKMETIIGKTTFYNRNL